MIRILKKINFLITKRQRKRLVILTLLLFIGMILEVFGLGILIPALSILLDPELIEKTPILNSLRTYFSEFSDQNFSILFFLLIVGVYFFKSLFLILLTHKQNRFLSSTTAYISNKLFESYLNQPYSFHLNRNSSELIKNIHLEVNYLHTFLLALITMFIEAGFVVAVLSTLIYIEPLGAISIGVFYGILSILFLKFTKTKLIAWGDLRKKLDTDVSKIALEGLGGIKDLKILGKTIFFKDRFSNKNFLKARLIANQGTVSQIPRFYLELISIIGLVSFIILMLNQGKDVKELITVLGVFVAATFRMIPSLNRILASTQSIKYLTPSLITIYDEIKSLKFSMPDNENKSSFTFKNKIVFNNVSFGFKDSRLILKDIDLKINKGETIGIIGESGSGKSTLVDLLIGLHKPKFGFISIDNQKDVQFNSSWKSKIGYVSQTIFLIDDSIENNIALGVLSNDIDKKRIKQVLKQVQLEGFIDSLESGVKTKVGDRGVQISGGQRQRIGIARALYSNPEILILDEATSALDSLTESRIIETISALKSQMTIVMIAHRLTTLSSVDQVYKVINGKIIKG